MIYVKLHFCHTLHVLHYLDLNYHAYPNIH